MRIDEIAAWSGAAGAAATHDIVVEGKLARVYWLRRINLPTEQQDLAPFTGGPIDPRQAGSAAFGAAVEMAIVVSLWPFRPTFA